MDYTTSYRDMTLKEEEVMLRVCRVWVGFPSWKALGVLTRGHTYAPSSNTLPEHFWTLANLLRPLCLLYYRYSSDSLWLFLLYS